MRLVINPFVNIWVNIDTRGRTKSPGSQNIAVGPWDPPPIITRIRYPMSQRVKEKLQNLIQYILITFNYICPTQQYYKIYNFVIQKATAQKNGVESYQRSISANRSNLTTSYGDVRHRGNMKNTRTH